MEALSQPSAAVDPRRYFESVKDRRSATPENDPVCLYLETTNRCNLLCTTCPRTYAELEPPADLSWELFTKIVDQIPNLQRAVLHGIGEPMLVKNLPRMVKYLKDRGTYVLFNTNGTLLNEKNGRALIAAGLSASRSMPPTQRRISRCAERITSRASFATCARSAPCRSARATRRRGCRPG
jgi:uncharacterized radical SAM superfamily Fe-S cluster-containing enzyme